MKKIDDSQLVLISPKVLFKNLKKFSNYYFSKYPELKLNFKKKIIFHPFMHMGKQNIIIEPKTYKKWISSYKNYISNNKLVIKGHPDSEIKNYNKIFNEFDNFIIPKKFRPVPAELFVLKYTTFYLGCYSTILLAYKRKNIKIINSPDNYINKILDIEYNSLKKVLKL